ncbi:putative component of NuA3 histone acetyltransferase complex [Basidiobolus ranarum]|uniref:Component of NuA3 histone acetyltransferase complex n=1 Tax=Basidiobolus ranarum TaxID=34480 RepID=A0ABR2W5Q8_9FUNG
MSLTTIVSLSLEDFRNSMTAQETDSRKRARTSAPIAECFYPDLLSAKNSQILAKEHAESKPYLYCKIDKLIDEQLLRDVREEILTKLHFTVKETDIYKVCQTGDLANLDGLPAHELAQLSSLFRLRNAIYSEEFRQFISDVTGCGPLSSSKTDLSTNIYRSGSHLLNHDDVIGSRRVSYILYLTDPDEPWVPEDGGALELYPVLEKGTPAVSPSVSIPPKWNQMVFFTVQPGHSFHSVEEVIVDKPILSVSGWFHIPQEGEVGYQAEKQIGEAPSSLQQLQESADALNPFKLYKEELEPEALDGLLEEDITELSKWLNVKYLNINILRQVSEKFVEESSIQLVDFLNEEFAKELLEATLKADEQDGLTLSKIPKHGTGERGQWKAVGPAHKHRFLAIDDTLPEDEEQSTKFLGQLQRSLFPSLAFRRWLAVVTQLVTKGYRGYARRMRPGLDYTLATADSCRSILDATLCLATSPNPKAVDLWESDEVGGYECYMAQDSDEDPAVYKSAAPDEDGALLTISAGCNVLSLVLRDEEVMKFTKYISSLAPGSRWDVAFEYELSPEE